VLVKPCNEFLCEVFKLISIKNLYGYSVQSCRHMLIIVANCSDLQSLKLYNLLNNSIGIAIIYGC